VNAASPRFSVVAKSLASAIRRGVYRPGDRFPSLRQSSRTHRVALGTTLRAYAELEAWGLIEARVRSGYFVCAPRSASHQEPNRTKPSSQLTSVDVSELVFRLLDEIKGSEFLPLGSAFPSTELFPLDTLGRVAAAAARHLHPRCSLRDLPPGNIALRRAIAQRYWMAGCDVDPEDILITNGAMEAINLCLQAVVRAGDAVAIESPTFYGTLQAIERLQLRAVEIPTDPRTGIDVEALARSIRKHNVKACVLMSTFQNPLGSSMVDEQKRELIELLRRHAVPLIEDDVYAELYHSGVRPRPIKVFDQTGLVMHCGTFSKSLAPGYRIGWVAAGRFHEPVMRLKMMTSIATASLSQAALADYLRQFAFERHLRTLRSKLAAQLQGMTSAIGDSFPAGCRVTRPMGGYFLWIELPRKVDSLRLHTLAARERISLAPGPLFSAQRGYRNCVRLNFGHPWTSEMTHGVRTLGALIRSVS
jgi:DNA-binding transcriptional MocR family regulator